jgi:Sec-independent protein translocase protein TatA
VLSPADMLIIGAAALIFFGPDQLPKVARKAGQVVREVQNTSQSFIREMERAAEVSEHREPEPDPSEMIDAYPHYGKYAEPTPAPESPVSGDSSLADTVAHDAVRTPAPAHGEGEPGRSGFAHEDASGI